MTLSLRHPLAVLGLVLNAGGAFGLMRFTANPDAGSELPHDALQALRSQMPELRREYAREIWAYRLSLAALAVGFILQLIDLLTA